MRKAGPRPLMIGEMVPDVSGRTDEGTPISISDFEGRDLALFLIGAGLGEAQQTIMKDIGDRIAEFMCRNCSPVVVSLEMEEVLRSYREMESLPFLVVSDPGGQIHLALAGRREEHPDGTWLVNDDGVVTAIVPALDPSEQSEAALAALTRKET